MPNAVPLSAVADRLDPWRHLDVRCALHRDDARAFVHGDALVCTWGAVVHAVSDRAFGPTAALLAAVRDALPRHLELRAGPAMGGILARDHHMQMVGPQQRLALTRPTVADPDGLVRLAPGDGPRIRALDDRHAPFADSWLAEGPWLGVVAADRLVAACGVRAAGGGAVVLAAPVLHRSHRREDTAARLLAALGRRLGGDLGLDVRMDHRDRVQHALDAGFTPVLPWERWRGRPWR